MTRAGGVPARIEVARARQFQVGAGGVARTLLARCDVRSPFPPAGRAVRFALVMTLVGRPFACRGEGLGLRLPDVQIVPALAVGNAHPTPPPKKN